MPLLFKGYDTDLKDYPDKSKSCLKSEKGATSLKREHAYYYQSQNNCSLLDTITCAFTEQIALFCERILPY